MGISVGRADNKKSNTRATSSGVTLLELLFAVMVAAVIIGLGSPMFGEFRRNAQLTRNANDFLTSVQRARSEAAKRQQPVSLCVAADPAVEAPVCSGAPLTGAAATGWVVFQDTNGDCERADAEPVIDKRGGSERLALAASSERTCISFAGNGFLRTDGGPRLVYDLLFCDPVDPRPAGFRAFKLSPSGHARVTRDAAEIADSELSCPIV